MRKLLVGCTLFAFVPALLAQDSVAQPSSAPVEIRIPAITSRLKRAGEQSAPEITIEEIERCIGQDTGMLRQTSALRQQRQALEAERASLDKRNAGLAESLASVDKTDANLRANMSRFQWASAEVQQQLSAIEKKRPTVRSQADSAAFNVLVKAYNADLARHNQWRAQLRSEHDAYSEVLRQHNASVLDANRSVASFNERNDAFQAVVAALASKSASFNAACAGERALRK